MKTRDRTVVLSVLIPILLIAGGFFLGRWYDSLSDPDAGDKAAGTREIHGAGKLTSPLLSCEVFPQLGNKAFDTFENEIRAFVEREKLSGAVSHVSLYFRELNNGAWFGIDEKEQFTPASLLKVPTLMAVLKSSERDPSVLGQTVTYDKSFGTGEPYFKPLKRIELGKQYRVDDLLERMIEYSDNEAMMALADQFDDAVFDATYKDLGLTVPKPDQEDYMTVKNYAAFFRILYNASYLTPADSERALEYLSKSTFTSGIVAGVPSGIPVAHKFGERYYQVSSVKQLHDCGIVYHPKTPYLVCIMTRGSDYDTLAHTISEISRSIWNEMVKRYPVN